MCLPLGAYQSWGCISHSNSRICIQYFDVCRVHMLCSTGYSSSSQMTDQFPSAACSVINTSVALPMDGVMPATYASGNQLLSFAGRFLSIR